jgi:predicted O-methyltransferase YrrM
LNNTFFQLKSFVTYFLDNVDEHSLHSPFFFKFYTQVLKTQSQTDGIARLESYRKKLVEDERLIMVEDLGAGSAHFKSNSSRKVSDIARTSLSPRKFSNLYSRIIKEYDYKNVIELGTSLGLNSLYLGLSTTTRVRTFEGSESVASIAEELFNFAGSQNIKLVRGNIDLTLPVELDANGILDFALMDANHRYAPTMNYFDMLASKVSAKGMVVLDDIHASQQMEKAWKSIQEDIRVHATADLYRCGVVFFDPSLDKQHVVLRF